MEIKKDEEEFEEYEAGSVCVRVAFIEENKEVESLDENSLKLHK